MSTPMPDIQYMPTNGHPFVSAEAWNELVYSIWNEDERLNVLEVMYSGGGIPFGSAVLWYGAVASLPEGWVICDGLNGTPDYRGLFLMGATEDGDLGETGGAETHIHGGGTLESAGEHEHAANNKTTGSTPSATTGVTGSGSSITPNSHSHTGDFTAQNAGAHIHTLGYSGPAGNYPPYKCAYWITRLP